jgi:hypothetical protein
VNLLRLRPGVSSSQRHWHTAQDEFVYVLSGEVTLVTDAGEETLRAGDAAGFKAGEAEGIACKTGPRPTPSFSKSVREFRTMPPITPSSIWSRRLAVCLPSTHTATARPMRI